MEVGWATEVEVEVEVAMAVAVALQLHWSAAGADGCHR